MNRILSAFLLLAFAGCLIDNPAPAESIEQLKYDFSPAEYPVTAGSSFVNGRSHDGEKLACDFPVELFMTNIGSRRDGLGMCVNTSIEMSALWAGLEQMRGFRDWTANFGGGSHSAQVDQQIAAWCRHKSITVPPYVQYTGDSPEEILSLCDQTSRMSAIAYGYSPRYGQPINHMVCCPKFSGRYGVVLDNNLIGGNTREKLFEWMDKAELVKRMKTMNRGGMPAKTKAWVFAWLAPSPPPVPFE